MGPKEYLCLTNVYYFIAVIDRASVPSLVIR